VSRGQLILQNDVQIGEKNGVTTYSNGVISALQGSLVINGSASVLQGEGDLDPKLPPAITVSSIDNDAVNVTINTTGKVNSRIVVYPSNASLINSSLTITNIHSTDAATEPSGMGGITASIRAANVNEKINVSGGTWGAFLYDFYCAQGKASVRMADGTYQVLDAGDSRIAAMNVSSFPTRYESLQDCVDMAKQPAREPEIALVNNVTLNSNVIFSRSCNMRLDLKGHTISGPGVLYNKMTGDPDNNKMYVLTIQDSVGGGSCPVKADRESTTYLGDLHAENRKDHFTLSSMDTVDGTPAAVVIGTNDFADQNAVSGWLWEEDNTVAANTKRLRRAVATLTMNGTITTYASIGAALDAAQAGNEGSIWLLQNTELTSVKTLTKTVAINLDGHTLAVGRNGGILASTGGDVIFTNGTITSENTGNCIIADRSKVTLGADLTVNGRVMAAGDNASLLITGATVNSSNGEAVSLISTGAPAVLTIDGGSVTSTNSAAVKAQNAAKIVVNGGTISSGSTSTYTEFNAGIYTYSSNAGCFAQVEINGGNISSAAGKAVVLTGAQEVKLYGGTLRGDLIFEGNGQQTSSLEITTGTVYGNVSVSNGRGTVYGGVIHGGVGARNATLSVMGGRYGIDPSTYVDKTN
jgi:hypothetical protein